ncbi:Type II secretion system protein G precursor [Phycisphaerae bacterium RAS1]|nr:Type II secretion system protein G precursor [Phycisphaerae bacterium RAS1]
MKRIVRRRHAGRRGFTLLEIIMVVAILGVLIAIVAGQFGGQTEVVKKDLTKAAIKTIAQKLELFKAQVGRYPTSEEGLAILLNKPSDERLAARWGGPYLTVDQVKDPWQHDYKYECPGQYNRDSFDLSSPGNNGNFGDEDDKGLCNWTTS